ncbi:MAG: DUF1992 domain-containing protein [Caldilineaceae bacterium]
MTTPNEHPSKDPSPRRPISKDKGADPMEKWNDLISERIENAMKDGAFDNLPGKGKPLVWNDNPNEPADVRMANKILKNNDLTPSWIADRKAILADIEKLRADIMRAWQRTRQDWPNTEREDPFLNEAGKSASWPQPAHPRHQHRAADPQPGTVAFPHGR